MKKRYIVLGLVALEIACLPIAAKILSTAMDMMPTHAIVTELPREDGLARLVVTSNTPFVLAAANVSSELDITVNKSGYINSTRFGDEARIPGPLEACAAPASTQPAIIYASERATSKADAEILSRSVIIEVKYAQATQPEFKIFPKRAGKKLKPAPACSAVAD